MSGLRHHESIASATRFRPTHRLDTSPRFACALVFSVLAFNLAVVGIVGMTLYQSREKAETQAGENCRNLAALLEKEITGLAERIDLTLMAVRDEVERQIAAGAIDDAAMDTLLARHDSRLPGALGLRIADGTGVIRHAVTGVVVKSAKIDDRPFF